MLYDCDANIYHIYVSSRPVEQISGCRWFNDTLEDLSGHLKLSNADNTNGLCWFKENVRNVQSQEVKLEISAVSLNGGQEDGSSEPLNGKMIFDEVIAGLFGMLTGLVTQMWNYNTLKGILKLSDIFHNTHRYAQIRLTFSGRVI